IANSHDPGRLMIDCTAIDPFDERGHLRRRPRRQKGPMVSQQRRRDASDLSGRLSCAEDDLRKALTDRAMMIERGKPQVFEGKRAKLLQGRRDADFSASDSAEKALETFPVHGPPFSGFATRSIRSLTALRQDFPSKSTALTSRTIGISTR